MEVGPVTVLSVSEAEVEVQRFRKAEESLSADLQAIRKKVADAEQVAGSRILDAKMSGNDAGSKSVVQELRSMEIERETTERALKSATYGRNMAEINLLRSRADEKREEAAGIRDQVTEREEKTARLLDQLKAHEETDYVPEPRHRELGPPLPGVSKSMKLRNRAGALEGDALKLDERARTLQFKLESGATSL